MSFAMLNSRKLVICGCILKLKELQNGNTELFAFLLVNVTQQQDIFIIINILSIKL